MASGTPGVPGSVAPPPPCSHNLFLTLPVSVLMQASPALGCQRPPQAPGGRCASHLLGLQTKELHLPHPGMGRISQWPLVRPAHSPAHSPADRPADRPARSPAHSPAHRPAHSPTCSPAHGQSRLSYCQALGAVRARAHRIGPLGTWDSCPSVQSPRSEVPCPLLPQGQLLLTSLRGAEGLLPLLPEEQVPEGRAAEDVGGGAGQRGKRLRGLRPLPLRGAQPERL